MRYFSIAPQRYFDHKPLGRLRQCDPQTLPSVSGEGLQIYGIRQVTMIHNSLAILTTFTIADVNCALLGLDTIKKNGSELKIESYSGFISNKMAKARLH
eukprot:6224906-Amphidinium_carterae.1